MDWLFETQTGPNLADTISDGLAQPPHDSEDTAAALLSALSSEAETEFDDAQFTAGDYDTMITQPGEGGDPDPDPNDPPPPEPPTHPEPLEPSGPRFDYSTLLAVPDLTAWLEWLGDSGPTHMGGGDYDSLAEFMNGEWHFEVDPELIDTGGFYGDYDQGGYVSYGQFGTTNNIVGLSGAGGALVPVFREWTEVVENPPGEGDDLPGITVIHHTDFLGFRRSNTYQVASLDGPQDWLGRAEGVMDLDDILDAYEQLLAGAQGEDNTVAIGEPFISQANGMLMAAVKLNGVFLGHVQVNDDGFRLLDRNGNLISANRPLSQNWDEIQGVIYWENQAHQERTMGVPFAQALTGLATVFTGGTISFFAGLGFGFASGVASGGSAADAAAYARLLEAAHELRLVQLRSRNGG